MKKTLKLVGIFIGILVVAIVGGLAGYNIIAKNQTYYIYDLRLVEPVEEAKSYIYRDSEREYTSIKNKKVYMTAYSENRFGIGIYAYTSNNTNQISLKSSDTDVAKFVYVDGKCFVEYMKAGVATISVKIGSVVDSFTLYVYDQVAEDFTVFDNTYYGEYSPYFENQIIAYSDDEIPEPYSYDYVAYSASGEGAGDLVNNALLRVDQATVNTDVFEFVKIDDINKQLIVQCKAGLTENTDETIVVQSYYYSEYGEIKVAQNYFVNIHVEAYTPEFLQAVISKTPDFEDGTVFVNTIETRLDSADVESNLEKLEQFLDYQKSEQQLSFENEKAIYNVYFTDKVEKLYVKFRKVYTNGYIEYLNPLTQENNPFTLTANSQYLKISANKSYYTLTLSRDDYFASDVDKTFDVKIQLGDFDLEHVFKFEFKEFTAENLPLFYDYDSETGVFTYKYWDPRTKYDDQIYDAEGNIIGFGGINIDYSLFE